MRLLKLLKIPYEALPDVLLHLKILHKLPLLPKICHLHILLSIILLNIVLLHMVILQSILLTLPLFKMHQLNKLLHNILHHMINLRSLLLKLWLLYKIHQLNKLISNVLLHMFILCSLLFKIHQMLQRSGMPLWTNPAKILRP
jgi:hypothetical protein